MEDLDIEKLITKLHDLEKLKILLLDEEQLVVFNYLSKPVIKIDDEKDYEETLSPSQRKVLNLTHRQKNAKLFLNEALVKTREKNDNLSRKLIDLFETV